MFHRQHFKSVISCGKEQFQNKTTCIHFQLYYLDLIYLEKLWIIFFKYQLHGLEDNSV